MKNKIILVVFIFAVFYLGGCMMHASFNIRYWNPQERSFLFAICTAVTIGALAMDHIIRDNNKSSKDQ